MNSNTIPTIVSPGMSSCSSIEELQNNLHLEYLVKTYFGKIKSYPHCLIATKPIHSTVKEINKILPGSIFGTISGNEESNGYIINPEFDVKYVVRHFDEKEILYVTIITAFEKYNDVFKSSFKKLGLKEYEEDKEDESRTSITFSYIGERGIVNTEKTFASISINSISDNYTSDVIAKVKRLINISKTTNHGLIVISGPAGTGKTYLIRAILSELKDKYQGVICSPATEFLKKANYLAEAVSEYDNSIIVLEDVGDILLKSASKEHIDARSNLLNFTDGLLSTFLDSLIIVSFNHDLDEIDDAIIRSGRCIENILVGKLPIEQAKKICPKLEIPSASSISLADIYASKAKI